MSYDKPKFTSFPVKWYATHVLTISFSKNNRQRANIVCPQTPGLSKNEQKWSSMHQSAPHHYRPSRDSNIGLCEALLEVMEECNLRRSEASNRETENTVESYRGITGFGFKCAYVYRRILYRNCLRQKRPASANASGREPSLSGRLDTQEPDGDDPESQTNLK